MAQRLRQHILEALRSGEPVVFGSEAQHDVITEVLHDLVFVDERDVQRPVMLRVMYVDGSEAEPFPLFCLSRQAVSLNASLLRVALMSMRHPELDPEIDVCWFRNRDVSRTRTLAETDSFCYRTTQNQVKDYLKLGALHMHLYHTGFEPAVIGFYRGIVQALTSYGLRTRLVVTPFYFRGKQGYQSGRDWS